MPVNKDLTVNLEPPPFLVNGDTSILNAMVHNNTNKPLPVQFKLTPGTLAVDGDLLQQFVLQANANQQLSWPIVASHTGGNDIEATEVSRRLATRRILEQMAADAVDGLAP